MAILSLIKRIDLLGYVGIALWIPCFLILVPFMSYWTYAVPVLLLAFVPAFLAYTFFKGDKILSGIVAGQALDGAATFYVIDVFGPAVGRSYFEQHVVSAAIGNLFGTFFTFYLLKTAIGFAAAYLLREEKMDVETRNYISLVLMIIGFAPGIRDILRMMLGT
jgi:uncharacterized membrane protein